MPNEKTKSFHLDKTKKDLASTSLGFAVFSVICFPLFVLIGFVLLATSLIAVIVGLMSLKSPKRKLALAGIIIGAISFIVYGYMYIQLMNLA